MIKESKKVNIIQKKILMSQIEIKIKIKKLYMNIWMQNI